MPVSAFASLVLLLGLGLGLAGDALLNVSPWGINVPIWCGGLLIGLAAVNHATRITLSPRFYLAAALWLAAAGLFAWRDADGLRGLNFVALAVITGVLMIEVQPRLSAPLNWTLALMERWVGIVERAFRVVDAWVRTRTPGSEEQKAKRLALARGLGLAAPVLLVFGGLLASADAVFENLVTSAFDWNLDAEVGFSHFLGFFVAAWFALGLLSAPGAPGLRGPVEPKAPAEAPVPPSPGYNLGLTEVGFVLGSLVALFGAFVAVQIQFLFGGSAQVQQVAGLSYAEYARGGFFQLVGVAALALPLLLGCRKVLDREGPKGHRLFLLLGGLTIGLLFVIMASAWMRMGLYVEAYGMTTLRLYVLAAMLWLGAVFTLLFATFAKKTPAVFAPLSTAAAIAGVFALNWVSPDSYAAEFNLRRAAEGKGLDVAYLHSLSLDAAPALAQGLLRLKETEAQSVREVLAQMAGRDDERDWRSWTWSEEKAARAATIAQARYAARE